MIKIAKKNYTNTLIQLLQQISERSKTETFTIETLFTALKGKGYPFLLILLSLPFCQPIQIPGFSTPFGIAIVFIGLRIAFGHRIWWPKSILKKEISSKFLQTVIDKSIWILKKLNRVTHERLVFFCDGYAIQILHGLVIALMGLFLALPLPIPLSNIAAAWSLVFLGLGLIENDGLFILLGYLIAFTCVIFLIIILITTLHFFAIL